RHRLSVDRTVPFWSSSNAPNASRARHRDRRRTRPLSTTDGTVRASGAAAASRRPRRRAGSRRIGRMTSPIDLVLFDIGGVLGSNGWDREQRMTAVHRFGLDDEDFQYRHEETVGALESGQISLDEYLDVTVFCD